MYVACVAQGSERQCEWPWRAGAVAALLTAALLYSRSAPPLFYAYFALPIGLWAEVLRQRAVRAAYGKSSRSG
eukprot:173216-Prorocentrum_minimum.AAC.1